MVGYIFIFLGAFFNACMDVFENENFFESIFKNWNQKFWYKRESWKYARKIGSFHIDAWHLAKAFMVISVAASLCFEYPSSWWVVMLNGGIVWNLSFKLFYNLIFRVK